MAYKRTTKVAKAVETTNTVEKSVQANIEVKGEDIKEEKTFETPEKNVEIKVAPVPTRVFNKEDFIPCRSLVKGELIYVGKKTKEIYTWSDYGDITEVEYQDLLALKAAKSSFIFDVLFVIEDEELLEDPKWQDVKELYKGVYSDDVESLISMNYNDFQKVFANLPKGLQKAVVSEVATQIEAGTFDSLQKIKIIDEVCNTDLSSIL